MCFVILWHFVARFHVSNSANVTGNPKYRVAQGYDRAKLGFEGRLCFVHNVVLTEKRLIQIVFGTAIYFLYILYPSLHETGACILLLLNGVVTAAPHCFPFHLDRIRI